MNFTVDDADQSFAYSANGWAVQSNSDPDREEFFEETYHVATADGATASIQFNGMGFALYGSKGPDHSQFQVQFDNTVVNLDASASETAFRQELFAHSFSTNESATHLVKVTAILSGDGVQGKWFDLDYITFISGTGTTSAIGTATSLPPWVSTTSSNAVSSTAGALATTPTSASKDGNVNNHLPTILAVLFGALIGVFLICLAAFLLLRRVYDRRRSREREFRYGQSSVNPSAASYAGTPTPGAGPGYNYHATAGAESAKGSARSGTGTGLAEMVTNVFASPVARGRSDSRAGTYTQQSDAGSYAYTHANAFDGAPSFASVPVPAVGVPPLPPPKSPGQGLGLGPVPASPTTNSSRLLLNASPIAWATGRKREGRSDADSMRTDFLQV